MRFPMFPLHLFKVLCLPRKSEAMSYEALRLSHKIILANLKIWCSKMQPLVRKSARWPPNISDEHVSCTAPAAWNSSLQIFFKCPMAANAFETATKPSRLALFWQGAEPVAPATTTVQRPKMVRHVVFLLCFYHFDFEMCFAPQRRALWIFNSSTSKSAPNPTAFHSFDFETCFAPQRRALFQQLDFKTACNFSSLISPDGSAPAALASLFFDPPEPGDIGKTRGLAAFLPFRTPASSFLWLFLFWSSFFFCSLLFSSPLLSSLLFSSLLFPSLPFPSLLFSDTSHLCFSICAHCRKFDF